jgi:hypothetical protein
MTSTLVFPYCGRVSSLTINGASWAKLQRQANEIGSDPLPSAHDGMRVRQDARTVLPGATVPPSAGKLPDQEPIPALIDRLSWEYPWSDETPQRRYRTSASSDIDATR